MNEFQIFKHPEFGKVRTLEIDGEPWLIGKDVAEVLGYSNPQYAIRTHVDDEDKGVTEICTPGGNQQMPIINESGLYSLVFSSKLHGARKFRSWVTGEVLPSIRKSCGYIHTQENMTSEELIATALVYAQKKIKEYDARIAALTAQNQIMAPKAKYFDELVERNTLTSFREMAKELGVKEKKFVRFLLDKSYIFRDKKGRIRPYADKNDGLFEVCFKGNTGKNGTQTLITPKGRETFRLLCKRLA